MQQKRKVITVDGLAGSGKTTLARLLAERLSWTHFSSGLLYRGVAWLVREHRVSPEDSQSVLDLMSVHRISLEADARSAGRLMIDGVDRSAAVRVPEVSDITSRISVHPSVRARLVAAQREAFPGINIVAEGRDMGTVIFPDSPLKFFIHASEAVRIERRLKQLNVGVAMSEEQRKHLIEQMEIEIRERDRRDSERDIAPTKPAPDAVIIDNSSLPLTIVVEHMYDAARKLTGA